MFLLFDYVVQVCTPAGHAMNVYGNECSRSELCFHLSGHSLLLSSNDMGVYYAADKSCSHNLSHVIIGLLLWLELILSIKKLLATGIKYCYKFHIFVDILSVYSYSKNCQIFITICYSSN